MKKTKRPDSDGPSESAKKSFLDAQRHWDSREGEIVATAKTWKMVAMISAVIAFIAVCGNVWIGSQNKLVPYVVEIDKEGAAVAVRRATRANPQSENIIRSMLSRFVRDWRSVYVDAEAQRLAIESTYSMLPSGTAASVKVSDWFRANMPFKRAESETVTVNLRSVLRLTNQTFKVEWDESRHSRGGELIEIRSWQANLSIVFRSPETDSEIIQNPIGLYVEDVNYTELLR